VLLGFGVAMTGGVRADRDAVSTPLTTDAAGLPWEDAHLLAEVMERVGREYVDPVTDHQLMENALRGMVSALDSHSAFLNAREYDEIRASTAGVYPGVGIEVAAEQAGIKVLKPIEGSPAERAGIQAGDFILSIDGRTVGSDLQDAIARMRGRNGSLVHLSVLRSGTPQPIDFTLRRADVEVHSVARAELEPGYGYVRISHFSETTADDLDRAVLALQRDNAPGLKGLVLDLRNNPGGVLEAAVDVSDAFLDSGIIVTADGRTPDSRFRMDATPGDLLAGAPLVVLVNGGSASAAEIVAGALKDHHRAVLIGQTTYGKGSVQTVMPLSHGRALKLTTSRYFTPSGESIQDKGIKPDVVVEGEEPPPADLAPLDSQHPLAQRDPEVRLALERLKSAQALPVSTAAAVTANVRR
jgi:carboxyl-terminal processing protease